MIKSFRDQVTEDIFDGKKIRRIDKKLVKRARRRLEYLNGATKLNDLYFPPSNHFHALQGFQPTRYAIRVNDQWRITFEWHENHAFDVYFEDYH